MATEKEAVANFDGSKAYTENFLPKRMDDFDPSQVDGIDLRAPVIKIIHQAQMFEMPDGEKTNNFKGVILDVSKQNAWWEESFDSSGGGTPPQCFSLDGIRPSPLAEVPQSDGLCEECPQNQFGSDGGRGKMCKNMRNIFVILPDSFLPNRITLPPSNLKALNGYVSNLVTKGLYPWSVITSFSLTGSANKDGIKYSELLAVKDSVLSPSTAEAIKLVRTEFMGVMRGTLVGEQ